MSVRGVLIRFDSTDSLCEQQVEVSSPRSPNLLKSDYFDSNARGKTQTGEAGGCQFLNCR